MATQPSPLPATQPPVRLRASSAGSGQFHRHLLPEPQAYYESQGLTLQRGGKAWRSTSCEFHGGSDSMRIHLPTGAFVCMAGCGARGGDVLAYHMAAHGVSFVQAARALGAWQEAAGGGGAAEPPHRRPAQPSARSLLAVVSEELMLCVVCLGAILRGTLPEADRSRFVEAAGRVRFVAELAGVEADAYE